MSETELRIGNLIQIGSITVTVQEIGFGLISTPEEGELSLGHKQISGIPLTEDWLKRFGFEQGALGSWIKSITVFGNLRELSFGGDYLYLREGKEVYGSGEDDLCVLWNKDVMKEFYVHQLQNLYFALTGEELKLN